MIESITLQNFKSFGEEQTFRLSPITVLVGPNNSGKTSFISLGRFLQNAIYYGATDSPRVVVHRRPYGDGVVHVGWSTERGRYLARLEGAGERLVQRYELLEHRERGPMTDWNPPGATISGVPVPFSGLATKASLPHDPHFEIARSLALSRTITLALTALRRDAELVPLPRLGPDGYGLPTVLGLWRGSDPERAEQLHAFVQRCLPEVKHIFVKPSPKPAHQKLWVQQTDGEQFEAELLSDGVLCFIALAMQVIEAEPGSLIFIEEPEQSIHPRRLSDLVELFRAVVEERKCQIVIATHSPTLLNEFREEPEAILLFRRSESGTRVKALKEFPGLLDALRNAGAQPGEMLADGNFNEPV